MTSVPSNRSDSLTALLTGVGVAPLDNTGWIRVTGEDRVRWLNGMVTNSIQALSPGQGNYHFVLNAQGRIQGDLTAFAEPAAILIETDLQRLPALMALLDRFIIMDDVELTDISNIRKGIVVAGPNAAALLESFDLPVTRIAPLNIQSATWKSAPVDIVHAHSPLVSRYELWSDAETIAVLTSCLTTAGAEHVSPEALEDLRILSGTPRYGTDIRNTETARDLPQETAQIGVPSRALHFSKGCYLGQEIVERIRSRGNVHRTFTGFQLTGALPAPGTVLTDASGKPVAEITSVAAIPLPSGAVHLALGYIRREALPDHAQTGSLPLTYPGGTATPINLPYSAF